MALVDLRARLARIANWRPSPSLLGDVAGVAGAGLVSYGVWSIYRPAGLITLGLLLLAAAWLNAKAGK